ncbi:MAG: aminopeptidase N [Parvularculaceae bacterium]
MRTDTPPRKIRLADYAPSAYAVDRVALDVALDPARTIVKGALAVRRRDGADANAPLVLDGEDLELLSIAIDGAPLRDGAYAVEGHVLTVEAPPAAFELTYEVAIDPSANTRLSGLYMSKGMFCTQCEAEGFRRIGYHLDRPDVLATFRTRIEADKAAYPVLLANGNLIDAGDVKSGRHFAVWEDPHPKPAYLFALVGGDLAVVEDRFVTRSGRDVALKVFVQKENAGKCGYALDALKRAMRWDEEAFGREYDLDIFMIVAVDHFNFGAMENKGLNVFNSAYVLASPETATDTDYENIESVVAHEYFHNWSGNRVTLRDWFQLCLKEGFTVFRDQEFSADMRSRAVQRIKDVRRLWASQFPEDAGPLAHPPRPDEYVTIDNFYTATVYEKGAEVVRMLKGLLGPEKFRAACDLYFERHDGEAATVEDFARAMEAASGLDLGQFRRWWSDAGAPTVTASCETAADGRVTLRLKQATKPTPGQPEKPPRRIPLAYAAIGATSERILDEGVVDFAEEDARVALGPFEEPARLSLLRGFSAPVSLVDDASLDDRLLILRAETDLFSRWAVADRLWKDLCLAEAGAEPAADRPGLSAGAVEATRAAFVAALADNLREALGPHGDPAFAAEILRAPGADDLAQEARVVDPLRLVAACDAVAGAIGDALKADLADAYDRLDKNLAGAPYAPTAADAGRRALKNAALARLAAIGETARAEAQAEAAANMTDEAAAVFALALGQTPARERALERFYARWRRDPLVVDKWLAWRAQRRGPDALDDVKSLLDHEAFDLGAPNKVRALISVFARRNLAAFHLPDGAGYDFVADRILALDEINPQLAARLITAFEDWRRLAEPYCGAAEARLRAIAEAGGLSDNLYEMAERLLGAEVVSRNG